MKVGNREFSGKGAREDAGTPWVRSRSRNCGRPIVNLLLMATVHEHVNAFAPHSTLQQAHTLHLRNVRAHFAHYGNTIDSARIKTVDRCHPGIAQGSIVEVAFLIEKSDLDWVSVNAHINPALEGHKPAVASVLDHWQNATAQVLRNGCFRQVSTSEQFLLSSRFHRIHLPVGIHREGGRISVQGFRPSLTNSTQVQARRGEGPLRAVLACRRLHSNADAAAMIFGFQPPAVFPARFERRSNGLIASPSSPFRLRPLPYSCLYLSPLAYQIRSRTRKRSQTEGPRNRVGAASGP
jgi:hypothetical protein